VAIWWRLTLGGEKCRLAHGILKNILGLRGLTGHEETKAIELR
jgi:hypothetical protein